jgi:uncharacterized protein YbbC (DUF1343 family)
VADWPEPTEWAIVQFSLAGPDIPPGKWNKPFVYAIESEADANDYTDGYGYTHHVRIIGRGFPTEDAAKKKLKEMGIL